ncbi:MAG: tRNA (guanine(10)-N(2))-dimethyltransferase [Candidatus Hadarchaeales archaeon]
MGRKLAEEGSVRFEIPDPEEYRTASGDYAPSLSEVFYNPRMEFCRDISVSVAQTLADELGELKICDPLGGVGIRGIRYAKEVRGAVDVLINDRSPAAHELASKNIQLNSPDIPVSAENEDANIVMLRNRGRFNFIDIDPFGSPARFVEAACASISRKGMIALTATDTGPLCGSYPRACLRRYGARPLRTEYCHELGIRILIGFCQRVAGKHDLALEPVLVHSTLHYFRVYLRAIRRSSLADKTVAGQGYISHCFRCGGRRVQPEALSGERCACGGSLHHSGPLWTGELWNREFLQKTISDISSRSFRQRAVEVELLSICLEESGGPPTFHDVNRIASMAGSSPPKMRRIMDSLRNSGRFASRTHFSPTGIRTDAEMDDLLALFRG